MLWFYIALFFPILWTINVFQDQYVGRKYFPKSASSLQALSGIFATITGIGIIIFNQSWLVGLENILMLIALGVLLNISLIPYIKALQGEDAGIAAPLFLLIPIFTFMFSFLILGETLMLNQILFSVLMIIAAVGLVWDFSTKAPRFKTIYYMGISCAGIGLFFTLSKFVNAEVHWLDTSAWVFVGQGILGVFIFCKTPRLLLQTKSVYQKHPVSLTSLFIFQELCSRTAMVLTQMALSIGPSAALVIQVSESIQPLYTLLLAPLMYKLSKKFFEKPVFDKYYAFRVFCIFLMILSLIGLYQSI